MKRSKLRRFLAGAGGFLGAAFALEGAACAAFRYVDRDGNTHEIEVVTAPAAAPEPAAGQPSEASYPHADLVREAAKLYSLPVELILAVMTIESGFDPKAVSSRGAMGLMQLMPGTAADMRVASPFDPRENILGGARYLRILVNGFEGDVTLALGAYHAGAGATQRHGGVPPFPETYRYVASVLRFYRLYQERGPNFAAVVADAIRRKVPVAERKAAAPRMATPAKSPARPAKARPRSRRPARTPRGDR